MILAENRCVAYLYVLRECLREFFVLVDAFTGNLEKGLVIAFLDCLVGVSFNLRLFTQGNPCFCLCPFYLVRLLADTD